MFLFFYIATICSEFHYTIFRMTANTKPNILYKDLGNGLYLCLICSQQIKAKAWTAHVNGRKHRETVQKLKEKVSSSSTKRLNEERVEDISDVDLKRSKSNHSLCIFWILGDGASNGQQNSDQTTPWQAEAKLRSEFNETIPRKNLIEGVPDGFFDDKALNSRVSVGIH